MFHSLPSIPCTFIQTSRVKPPAYVVDQIREKLSPQWEYRHFTDEDIYLFFIENPDPEFPYMISKFYSFPYGEHRADLFRYYYLYQNGGVYMDTDAMLETPIENLVRNHSFFSVNSSYFPQSVFQGILGATPKHPLLFQAMKNIYEIDIPVLSSDFHLLCKNLYRYFHESNEPNIHLYEEIYGNEEEAYVVDENQTLLAIHYHLTKKIPDKRNLLV
jgi:mannosyltransferase OCH1-like enzyme